MQRSNKLLRAFSFISSPARWASASTSLGNSDLSPPVFFRLGQQFGTLAYIPRSLYSLVGIVPSASFLPRPDPQRADCRCTFSGSRSVIKRNYVRSAVPRAKAREQKGVGLTRKPPGAMCVCVCWWSPPLGFNQTWRKQSTRILLPFFRIAESYPSDSRALRAFPSFKLARCINTERCFLLFTLLHNSYNNIWGGEAKELSVRITWSSFPTVTKQKKKNK